jgi:hypothetical protein
MIFPGLTGIGAAMRGADTQELLPPVAIAAVVRSPRS